VKKSCWLLAVGYWLLGCGPSNPNTDVRHWTDSFAFRVTVEPMPPEALEPAVYKVVVRDRKTNQPVENGTYYARLYYVISGEWAIAIQFRRDSTQRLERADWRQTVRPSTKPGY
jgi:hypothetical protein